MYFPRLMRASLPDLAISSNALMFVVQNLEFSVEDRLICDLGNGNGNVLCDGSLLMGRHSSRSLSKSDFSLSNGAQDLFALGDPDVCLRLVAPSSDTNVYSALRLCWIIIWNACSYFGATDGRTNGPRRKPTIGLEAIFVSGYVV